MKMKLLKDTKHETENLNNKSNFYINLVMPSLTALTIRKFTIHVLNVPHYILYYCFDKSL